MTPNFPDVDSAARELEARIAAARETTAQLGSIQGEARTRDGAVRVRVDATGALLDVHLGPTTSGVNREWLGSTIVQLTREAAEIAAREVASHFDGVREAQRRLQDRIAAEDPVQGERLRRMSESTHTARSHLPPFEDQFD